MKREEFKMPDDYVIVALLEHSNHGFNGHVLCNIFDDTYFGGSTPKEGKWVKDINIAKIFPYTAKHWEYLGTVKCLIVRNIQDKYPIDPDIPFLVRLVLLNRKYVFYVENQGFLCTGVGYAAFRNDPRHKDVLALRDITSAKSMLEIIRSDLS